MALKDLLHFFNVNFCFWLFLYLSCHSVEKNCNVPLLFLFHLLRSVHLNMGVCTVYKLWLHIVLERLQSGGQTIIEAGTVIYETTYNSDTNSEWHEQSERVWTLWSRLSSQNSARYLRLWLAQHTEPPNHLERVEREMLAWIDKQRPWTGKGNWEFFHRARQAIMWDLRSAVVAHTVGAALWGIRQAAGRSQNHRGDMLFNPQICLVALKGKFGLFLRIHRPVESWVEFHSPQNISGASQQKQCCNILLNTEADGDLLEACWTFGITEIPNWKDVIYTPHHFRWL